MYKDTLLNEKGREGFTSSFGVIMATLGSAVGLGNIWKFPFLAGENGGAAFILVYLICTAFIGIIVMISEFIIGRSAKANAVGAFKLLAPSQLWVSAGWFGICAAFLIMAFYTGVAGWVFAYVFKAITGSLHGIDADGAEGAFSSLVASPLEALFWQWLVLVLIGFIITMGVQKGIERITKILLPLLFVLLLVCDIRALTLPGAAEGLRFLFSPDFGKISGPVVLTAMGLAFFKLSVGMGTMITYGSYMGKEENMPITAIRVALADVLVSILAGMAIFPAVFAFGFQPNAGPSLLFITIPMIFNSMPMGHIFLMVFFLLTAFAATGAMISLLEVPVAWLVEEKKLRRSTATLISIGIMGAMGILSTLSFSVLKGQLIFGKSWFDFYDFISSNVFLPIGGLVICLFVGWKLGPSIIDKEASNNGKLKNIKLLSVYTFIVRFVAPVAILVVLLDGLSVI